MLNDVLDELKVMAFDEVNELKMNDYGMVVSLGLACRETMGIYLVYICLESAIRGTRLLRFLQERDHSMVLED